MVSHSILFQWLWKWQQHNPINYNNNQRRIFNNKNSFIVCCCWCWWSYWIRLIGCGLIVFEIVRFLQSGNSYRISHKEKKIMIHAMVLNSFHTNLVKTKIRQCRRCLSTVLWCEDLFFFLPLKFKFIYSSVIKLKANALPIKRYYFFLLFVSFIFFFLLLRVLRRNKSRAHESTVLQNYYFYGSTSSAYILCLKQNKKNIQMKYIRVRIIVAGARSRLHFFFM